ncbi:hypothetical protein SUDANB95_01879 [Actinosynnema sp. ALI-1.44]
MVDPVANRLSRWWRTKARTYLPRLLGAAFVEWIGTGLFIAASAVYFVRVVGLSEQAVGVGMAIAGLVSMLTAVPVGALADRFGVRRALIATSLWRAAAVGGYPFVDGWWPFVLVTTAVVMGEQAAHPLTQALVGERTTEHHRPRVMAAHRVVLNLGISTGGLAAAVPLAIGTATAFHWLFASVALLFAITAALIARLPEVPQPPRPTVRRFAALRDRKLLALTAYDSAAALWLPMLNVAFPLWLTGHTNAPAALVGVLYAVNTATCVLLQIPLSRFTVTVRDALRSYTLSGTLLAVSCLGFALAPTLDGAAVPAVFAVTILILTIGELFQVNAAWTFSYALAPATRRAEYLAAFSLGRTGSTRLYGPLLMTGVVLALGTHGWLLLSALMATTAALPQALRRHFTTPTHANTPTA